MIVTLDLAFSLAERLNGDKTNFPETAIIHNNPRSCTYLSLSNGKACRQKNYANQKG